jgi:VCBS repeat-containing protein
MKQAIKFLFVRGFFLILLLFMLLDMPLPVSAASNSITIGTLTLYPSLEVCSVILSYTGDDNNNATVNMQWRVHGTSAWKQGMDMTRDTRATVVGNEGSPSYITNAWKNQFRAVILLPLSVLNSSGTGFTSTSITPNTTYDVQITVTDPDGVTGTNPATGSFTTWNTDPPSTGNTYYVSTSGTSSNPGTYASPWSLAKAISTVNAGDTVMLLPGTYSGQRTFTRSGTANNYITWRSYDYGNPATITHNTYEQSTLNVHGASYNRFEGLIVAHESSSPVFYIDGTSVRTIIEDCVFHVDGGGYWNVGVAQPDANVSETIIRGNTFYTNVQGNDGGPFCVEMDFASVRGTVFCDNVVSNSGGNFGDSINNGLYMNGHAYRNIITGCNDDGIEFENEGICCTLWCNIITDCYASCIAVAPVTVGPVYVFRNVIPGPAIGSGGNAGVKEGYDSNGFVYFYNNTFAYSAESIVTDSADNPNRHEVNAFYRNNIFYNTGAGYIVQYNGYGDGDWDYDLMYNGSSGTSMKWFGTQYSYSAWRSAYPTQEAHGLNSNPSLTTTTGDVSLKATSPCIDKGVIINGFNDADSAWAYSGTAPDIGANEYASGTATLTITTASLAAGDVNVAYSRTLAASSGVTPYTWSIASGSLPAGLSLASSGVISGTPTTAVTSTVTYRVIDNASATATKSLSITINAAVSVATASLSSGNTGAAYAQTLSASGGSGTYTWSITSGSLPTGLSLGSSSGAIAGTPTIAGTSSFTVQASDGIGTATKALSITINAANTPPVAVNDTYTINEDTALNVAAAGVLNNDTDADGNPLTAANITCPAHGTLTFNTNGLFTYIPAANYNGTDSFTYRVNDGQANSNTATVTVTITAVNDAPVAVNDTYTTNEDTALNVAAAGVLSNDTDADSNPLTAANITSPAHGALTFNTNGSFTYIPAANYNGTDSFTYRVNDGQANSNTATVTITITAVNDAPVAVNDTYTTNEDTVLSVASPGVLSNDTDVDGNSLTAYKVRNPYHGTVTLSSNGSFVYTPSANYNGTDTFTYRARDGQSYSSTVTVTITINAVNDAPVAVNDAYTALKNTALNIAVPGILGNDTDADGNTLTAANITGPSHGTLTFNTDGSFIYTPASNYTGTDTFTYRANDGQANSNTATVTITVSTTNSAPVALNDSYSIEENTALSIAAPGVLGNDTDADGNSLTATKIISPAHGTLTFYTNGSFIYTPASDYTGTDTFTYRANDGQANSNTATVTITITVHVNNAPTLDAIGNKSAIEGQLLTFTLSAADPDGDILTYSASNILNGALLDQDTGVFSWTPSRGQAGTYTNVHFEVTDGTVSDFENITIVVEVAPAPLLSGGGGGGLVGTSSCGGGASGITSLIGSVNSEGRTFEEVTASDIDLKITIRIPNGTIVKNRVGQALTSIRITPMGESQSANSGSTIIGQSYEVEPTGATFNTSAFIIFKYSSSDIPSDIPANNLYIALWDPNTLTWIDLGGALDTVAGTITLPIQHLSTYALMAHSRPANVQMSKLTLMPEEIATGETLKANVFLNNQGDLTGKYTISLKLDNATMQTKDITLLGGRSETFSFDIVSDTNGSHQVSAGDVHATFVVKKPLSPANFEVSEIIVNPLLIESGNKIDVSVLVKNTGDLSGTYPAVMTVDDIAIKTQEVTLAGSAGRIVTFSFTSDAVGQHKISFGGLVAPFEVISPPLLPPPVGNISGPEISSFSVAPGFDPSTNKLVYARVVYKMNQEWESLGNVKLMLTVFNNNQYVEQIPMLTLSQIKLDGKTGELDYTPTPGWQIGEYSFRAELFKNESLIQDTSFEHLIVTSEQTTAVVSWKTLGVIIGGVFVLGTIILIFVLYSRRDMLRDYWK